MVAGEYSRLYCKITLQLELLLPAEYETAVFHVCTYAHTHTHKSVNNNCCTRLSAGASVRALILF